ncbi:alpha-hydroxy-acid oxidizing protein [Agrobacterium tumefaciens]|uniref:alpha-hydroxy acid oxidase n=1 Tax=Agrobacterium tumefaciens TaxID=358 RepID=UPI001572E7EE|nr:alpha-hydroxy acid oxidase [Agrobacterium tumefaciens]NTB96041.1 alpha-hydroxy-acid oxidizing protein [Agrobacterium tumefaciens]NTC42972.1 alpha-hydroxy-acid oxidizing protein [Agrobacterium tumefaciens]
MSTPLTIGDLKEKARRRVPKMFFEYADSGAWSERAYRANEEDFGSISLRQRVMTNITDRTLQTKMIGQPVTMPVAIAPTGMAGMQYPEGEMLAAKAAEEFGVPYTLSTMSICSIEDVASATTKPFWFQLYIMRDRDFVISLMDRARAAGCSALVLTVDLQILGQRHKDLRNGLSAPPKLTPKHMLQMACRPSWCLRMLRTKRRHFGNIIGHAQDVSDMSSLLAWTSEQFDPHLSWRDVLWVKDQWKGPLIIKGILDVDDAKAAIDVGADAIVVSNHGGRQLDVVPSSISMLPRIAEAVEGKVELHLDGGIRSGQDVLKAIALGAKGTYIGRPYLYGLGAMGKEGVSLALSIIHKEMDQAMALCGKRDIQDIGASIIASC